MINALTAVGALRALIDFTLSNARRFYSLAVKVSRILLFPSRNLSSSAIKGGFFTGSQSGNMETRLDLKTLTKARKKTTKMQEMSGMETETSFNLIADD